ncbi:MAG: 7-cyano-7-deazaguanine synthase QueC [Gemmataceae bacterium]|nr:7-cyano-7-deazaguanine synthase QueC [Gemmataceae bacterium]
MKKAVVLLSGGLDSATVLALAREQGYALYSLSIDYGQRHRIELLQAKKIAQQMGVVEHKIVSIDLRSIGGSALTSSIAVPKDRPEESISTGIPVTYVPARNTIFLSCCLGYAEVIGAFDLFIGANAIDYSGYPDCRPEFLQAFEKLANLATKASVEGAGKFTIHAPLVHLSKAEIIRRGTALGVNYAETISCYDPDLNGLACGHCDSCQLRRKGFTEAGLPDPTRYVGNSTDTH